MATDPWSVVSITPMTAPSSASDAPASYPVAPGVDPNQAFTIYNTPRPPRAAPPSPDAKPDDNADGRLPDVTVRAPPDAGAPGAAADPWAVVSVTPLAPPQAPPQAPASGPAAPDMPPPMAVPMPQGPMPPQGAAPAPAQGDTAPPGPTSPAVPPLAGVMPLPQAASPAPPPGASPQLPTVPQAPSAPPPQAPAPAQLPIQSQPPGWAHTGGVAASRFLEGAARAATLPMDLADWADRNTIGRLPLPSWLARAPMASMSDTIDKMATQYGAVPQTQGERLIGDVAGGVGGVAGGFGLGGAVRGLGGVLANTVGTGLGRMVRGAGSALPSAVGRFLTAAPIAQTVGGVGSGIAGNVAQQAGLSPNQQMIAELGGGLAGGGAAVGTAGALRAAGGVSRGFTTAGQRRIAAEMLLRHAENPAALRSNIAAGMAQGGRLPGAPITTAMASGDPALIVRESALRNQPGGQGIKAVEAARNRRVAEALERLGAAPSVTSSQRGHVIRRVLGTQERDVNTRTGQLYDAARQGTGTFSTAPLRNELGRVSRKYYGPGGGPAPSAYSGIVQQITDHGTTASAEWLMNMDRQIGNAIGNARQAGDNTLASALGELRDAAGNINRTAEHTAAKAHRARAGAVFGRDETGAKATGDILRTDRYGRPMLDDEHVAARAVRDASSVRQVLRAGEEAVASARASGASPAQIARLQADIAASRAVMRDEFLDNAEQRARLSGETISLDATGQPQSHATYSPAGWSKFWDANEETAGLLFSPSERRTLQQLTDQLAETAKAQRTSSTINSATAQNLAFSGDSPTVAHIFFAMTQGTINPDSVPGRLLFAGAARMAATAIGSSVGGVTGGFAGRDLVHWLSEAMFKGSDKAVNAILHDAMADPQKAQALLSKATPQMIARVLLQAQGDSGSRLGGLLRRAGVVARGEFRQQGAQGTPEETQTIPGRRPPPVSASPFGTFAP